MTAAVQWEDFPYVPGAFWPCEAAGDRDRAWVERVDFPDDPTEPVHEDDQAAAFAVAKATGWPLRWAPLQTCGRPYPAPYVQPTANDDYPADPFRRWIA
jgi:hypothetical protein